MDAVRLELLGSTLAAGQQRGGEAELAASLNEHPDAARVRVIQGTVALIVEESDHPHTLAGLRERLAGQPFATSYSKLIHYTLLDMLDNGHLVSGSGEPLGWRPPKTNAYAEMLEAATI